MLACASVGFIFVLLAVVVVGVVAAGFKHFNKRKNNG